MSVRLSKITTALATESLDLSAPLGSMMAHSPTHLSTLLGLNFPSSMLSAAAASSRLAGIPNGLPLPLNGSSAAVPEPEASSSSYDLDAARRDAGGGDHSFLQSWVAPSNGIYNEGTLMNGSLIGGPPTLAATLNGHLGNGNGLPTTGMNGLAGLSIPSSTLTPSSSHSHLRNSPADKLSPTYKRMAQRRKVPEGELCAVCSDLATGYHYGVASCNGCKTFFRRTIVSDQSFVCQYSGNCDVNKNIRCACRHCRFNKCIKVGMDANAIQNDRDRIGPTKKMKMGSGSDEEPTTPVMKADPDAPEVYRSGGTNWPEFFGLKNMEEYSQERTDELLKYEKLTNELRRRVIPYVQTVDDALQTDCLLFHTDDMKYDITTEFKDLYPASMKDVRQWNIREMRLCIEWIKTFDSFMRLGRADKMALLRNFAFAFNILNRVYYSPDYGPDKIVYLNGAFILRHTQNEVKLSGCRLIYTRQIDEIMLPMRRLRITIPEFATFKAALLFNPDAYDLSAEAKQEIFEERNKYLSALFVQIVSKMGLNNGVQKYGALLMMTASIQNIITQNEENMQVMDLFKNWEIDPFVKELCLKRQAD